MGPICILCAAESLQLESESGFRRIEADYCAEERVGSMEILEHVTHIAKIPFAFEYAARDTFVSAVASSERRQAGGLHCVLSIHFDHRAAQRFVSSDLSETAFCAVAFSCSISLQIRDRFSRFIELPFDRKQVGAEQMDVPLFTPESRKLSFPPGNRPPLC
jgi:hypothetical protein